MLENVNTSLGRNSDRLTELRQDFSQFNSEGQELRASYADELAVLMQNFSLEVEELRAHNIEQLSDLSQNFSQLQYNLQQFRAEVDVYCPFLISSCSSLHPASTTGRGPPMVLLWSLTVMLPYRVVTSLEDESG